MILRGMDFFHHMFASKKQKSRRAEKFGGGSGKGPKDAG